MEDQVFYNAKSTAKVRGVIENLHSKFPFRPEIQEDQDLLDELADEIIVGGVMKLDHSDFILKDGRILRLVLINQKDYAAVIVNES